MSDENRDFIEWWDASGAPRRKSAVIEMLAENKRLRASLAVVTEKYDTTKQLLVAHDANSAVKALEDARGEITKDATFGGNDDEVLDRAITILERLGAPHD